MTGLDVEKDHIMEIACVITDADLNIIAQQPEIIINQPSHVLEQMGEWCTKQHASVSCLATANHIILLRGCYATR